MSTLKVSNDDSTCSLAKKEALCFAFQWVEISPKGELSLVALYGTMFLIASTELLKCTESKKKLIIYFFFWNVFPKEG